ncbi:hypothetical protein ACHAQH_003487 [Verticillium albo-atrum]
MAHGTKVRTGCLTCKKRKIKCDEAKPACSRCTSTGRTCAGYEMEHQRSPQERSLAWYRPHQLIAHDQTEGRAFQYFSRVVGPVLAGPQDAYFWTHLVMQFGHFAPAVRHAVLAISSLHEDFQNGKRISSELPGNPFALKHYNASLRHIQAARDENLVLLTCVLYLCVAYLLGDIDSVIRHCWYGIAIIAESGCSGWARDYLLPIFRRLHASPFAAGPFRKGTPLPLDFHMDSEDMNTHPFATTAEAETSLCDLKNLMRDLSPKGPSSMQSLPKCEPGYRAHCEGLLDRWLLRVTPLLESPAASTAERCLLCHLRASFETLRIQVNTGGDDSEMSFDRHTEQFRTMMDLAEEAAALRAVPPVSMQPQRACFTFEPGLLPVLSFTSSRCRDLPIRLKALTLMGSVVAAKEGLFDVGTMYRISRRVIEMEHGMSVEDCVRAVEQRDVPYPPEVKRVFAVDFDHNLQARRAPGGETIYRRAIKMLVRTPEGPRVVASEYITDDMPVHCPGIPSMRSALMSSSVEKR